MYVIRIHEIRNFAIKLHNEFKPDWKLDDTIEFVWQLKLNCLSNEEIRKWFKKMVNPTRGNDVDIIVEHLPDKFVRDDWS